VVPNPAAPIASPGTAQPNSPSGGPGSVQPAPSGAPDEKPVNVARGFMIGGAATFVVSYAAAAIYGSYARTCTTNTDCGSRPYVRLVIPLVGPFTCLGSGSSLGNAVVIADGVLQVVGVSVAGVAALAGGLSTGGQAKRATLTPIVGDRSLGVAGTF